MGTLEHSILNWSECLHLFSNRSKFPVLPFSTVWRFWFPGLLPKEDRLKKNLIQPPSIYLSNELLLWQVVLICRSSATASPGNLYPISPTARDSFYGDWQLCICGTLLPTSAGSGASVGFLKFRQERSSLNVSLLFAQLRSSEQETGTYLSSAFHPSLKPRDHQIDACRNTFFFMAGISKFCGNPR